MLEQVPFALIGSVFDAIKGNKDARRAENAQQRQINADNVRRAAIERLARTGTTDTLGNTTRYEEGKGFVSKASPIIQAILDAQTRTQLQNATKGAEDERTFRDAKNKRASDAAGLYERVFGEVTSRYRKPESEYAAEGVLGALEDRSNVGNPVAAALVAQAIRSGNPAMLAQIGKATSGQGSVGATIRAGKDQGTARYMQEKSNRDTIDFNELGQLRAIADDTSIVTDGRNNTNEVLAGRNNDAMATLMQALQGGGSRTVQPVNSPGVGGIFNALDQQYGSGKAKTDPELEALLRRAQMAKAEEQIASSGDALRKYQGNRGRV